MTPSKTCELKTGGRAVLCHSAGRKAVEVITTASGRQVAVCANCAAYQRARRLQRANPALQGGDTTVLALATILQGASLDELTGRRRSAAWHYAKLWAKAGLVRHVKEAQFRLARETRQESDHV